MKIRLLKNDAGYVGLTNVQFPVEVEVVLHSEDLINFFVSQRTMSKIPGWFWSKEDVAPGCNYVFWKDEVEIVEEKKSLSNLFGENGHEEAKHIGEATAKDLAEKVFDANRKKLLLELIVQYGEAVKDTSVMGDSGFDELAYAVCKAEEDRLLTEITKMIEEGV